MISPQLLLQEGGIDQHLKQVELCRGMHVKHIACHDCVPQLKVAVLAAAVEATLGRGADALVVLCVQPQASEFQQMLADSCHCGSIGVFAYILCGLSHERLPGLRAGRVAGALKPV